MAKLRKGEHVILAYEDSNYARGIEFGIIQDGLQKGEYCVYSSVFDEPQEIERKMELFGIDVKEYKERNLFRAMKLSASPGVNANEQEREELRKIVFPDDPKRIPFRLVGRLFPIELFSPSQLRDNLRVERGMQNSFTGQEGIAVCSYYTKNLTSLHYEASSLRYEWFLGILKAHDVAVFAPSPGRGAAFHMG